MRRSIAVSLLLALALPSRVAVAAETAPARPIERAAWLAGCWERRTATASVEERWMEPRGGTMFGVSRTVVRDTTREFEFVELREDGGRLVYHARPSGQPGAEFRSISVTDTLIVFENPGHDFPQRILYRRVGPDSLRARIEGLRNGVERGVDFPYRRVRCE